MGKTRTIGQKWLANELDLPFLTLKSVPKAIQSVNSFKSYRANKLKSTVRHTDRQTDIQTDIQTDRQPHSRKPLFRVQRVSKRGHFTKTGGGGHILHKSNTFSDENGKNQTNCICKYVKKRDSKIYMKTNLRLRGTERGRNSNADLYICQ